MSIIRQDKNVTASALFGVAAIHIFVAGIDWFLHGGQFGRFGWIDWLITSSGPIYIVLAIAARWIRLPAAMIGSVLFAFLALQSSGMLFFNLPVVILLLVAVVSALKRPAAER